MFDILELDCLAPAEEGRDFTPRHPLTNAPWLDEAGRPITITLLGRWAGVCMQTAEAQEARRQARPAGAPPPTADDRTADDAEYLAAATRRWSFTHLGGAEFPFTPENARTLYLDPRMGWLRLQAYRFHQQDGHFLAQPKPRSTGQNAASD